MNAQDKSRQFCSVCKEWLEMEVVPTSDGDDDDGVIWYRCPQCQGFLPKLRGRDADEEAAGSSSLQGVYAGEDAPAAGISAADSGAVESPAEDPEADEALPWDSPADMMAALEKQEKETGQDQDDDPLLGVAEAEQAGRRKGPTSEGGEAETPDLIADLPSLADEEVLDDLEVDLGAVLDPEPDDEAEDDAGEASAASSEPAEPLHEYAAMLAELDPGEAASYRPWGTYEVGQCIHHLAWDDCGVVVAKETLPGKRQVIKVYFEEAGVVRLIEQAPR